ncbi:sensor histidine kinase [Acetobacterium tundrae]|uniref:histidine kinase n=1 Tax=Acetobacterium tundrae TaxID=132932 RepID=A0ABR6WM05_9FIRM|nr:ATP-binding protein [Acetobacterium tundrae]MBC3797301.1 HAMP domain-containing protein [Acetobacterium tundrae]
MKHSLRTKLTLTIALVMLITIALISILANFLIEKQFTTYLASQQQNQTQEIANSLSQHYNAATKTWDTNFVQTIGMDALYDGYIITVYDLDKQTIWDAQTCDMNQCSQVMNDITQSMAMKYPQLNGEFTSKIVDITANNEKIGTVSIGYYGPYFLNENDFQFLQALNEILIGIAIFSLFFSVVVGTILAKRFSRPILKTVNATRQISDGDYAVRIEGNSNTRELDELIGSINHLADSLGKQEALRKQLTADVAHELRTPITSIGTHIEAMIEGVWEPTIERLQSCYDEILRIGKITADLESLAKVESENLKLDKTKINLTELAQKAVGNFEADINKKHLKISMDGNGSDVWADRDRISQVLINLLSNAVKYTPDGGAIQIVCSETDQWAKITIKDTGIGIPEDELPFVFERFYRADKCRNRKTGGSGIGLAIVKSIVTAHGGSVEAESRLNEGSCFTVMLPK